MFPTNKSKPERGRRTLSSVGMLVQQTTTPLKGWAESKSDSSLSKVAGGVVIASLVGYSSKQGEQMAVFTKHM
jgi:hypothetical protein